MIEFPKGKKLPPLPEMSPDLIFYREEPVKIENGLQESVKHVGATENKLDELKATLEARFDETPAFKSLRFNNHDKTVPDGENQEYILQGNVQGIMHYVSLQYIGCPVPYSMAQIHHASVIVVEGKEDKLSSVVKQEFLKYETEFKQELKRGEEFMKAEMESETE